MRAYVYSAGDVRVYSADDVRVYSRTTHPRASARGCGVTPKTHRWRSVRYYSIGRLLDGDDLKADSLEQFTEYIGAGVSSTGEVSVHRGG